MRIEESVREAGKVSLKGICLKTGHPFEFRAEKVLLAAGRRPNSDFLQEGFGGLLDSRGFVRVDARLESGRAGDLRHRRPDRRQVAGP